MSPARKSSASRKKAAPKKAATRKAAARSTASRKTSASKKTTTKGKAASKKAAGKGRKAAPAKKTARSKMTATKTAKKTSAKAGAKSGTKKAAAKKATKKATAKAKAAPKKAAKAAAKTASKAAAKAPAKKAEKPAPRKKLSPKARLAAVLEKLDRSFGALQLPETRDVLERAVYLVLREGSTHSANDKALKALREEFVDWNEVRLSSPSEMARLLTGTSKANVLRRWHERSRRVSEMIDQVYNDRNEATMEFVAEERPKAQIEILEDLDDLGLHNAYALVQWLADDDKLTLVSKEMAEASQALGLTDSAAVAKVRKELSSLVPKDLYVTIQAHLNQLGNLDRDEWPGSLKELLD